jgi:UDP-3-O-[3-hydroxymyristoyl] glucosamine N-acyltransferase
VIGDNTVIGQRTEIQAGVMIGMNVDIGRDSLITMDVADGTVLPKNSMF